MDADKDHRQTISRNLEIYITYTSINTYTNIYTHTHIYNSQTNSYYNMTYLKKNIPFRTSNQH